MFCQRCPQFISKRRKKIKKYIQSKEEIWARAVPSSGPGCRQAHSGWRLTAPSCFFTSRDLSGEGQGGGRGHLARDSCVVLGYRAATVPSSAGTDLALRVPVGRRPLCAPSVAAHACTKRVRRLEQRADVQCLYNNIRVSRHRGCLGADDLQTALALARHALGK